MSSDSKPRADAPQLPPARPRVRRAAAASASAPAPAPAPEPGPAPRHYDVGYKKPPVHTRFPPGKSGNPKGRPRGAKGINTIVRDTMTAKVAVRTAEGTCKMSRMEVVIQKAVELALKGNPRALDLLIKLYAIAVPDRVEEAATGGAEDFTASDLAILEALRQSLGAPDASPATDAASSITSDANGEAAGSIENTDQGQEPPTDTSAPEPCAGDWDREI